MKLFSFLPGIILWSLFFRSTNVWIIAMIIVIPGLVSWAIVKPRPRNR